MRNANVFQYVQHNCWDPIPSEQKGHLWIPTEIYHVALFSPTFVKLDSCSEVAPKNSCPGALLAAARRTGCMDIPRYLQQTALGRNPWDGRFLESFSCSVEKRMIMKQRRGRECAS